AAIARSGQAGVVGVAGRSTRERCRSLDAGRALRPLRTAIDTNILVYAEGVNGLDRRQPALNVLRRRPAATTLLPIQALGELYNVLIRKAGYAAGDSRARLIGWSMSYPTAGTTRSALIAASDLAATHRLGIWDSIMIAVAAENGCQLLLSED